MVRRTQLIVSVLLLAALTSILILAAAFFYGNLEIQRQLGKLRLHEASELNLGSAALRQTIGSITSDMEFLSAMPRLQISVQSPTSGNLDRLADNFAAFMNANSVYNQIRWIDESGIERLRLDYDRSKKRALLATQSKLQNKSNRNYFVRSGQMTPGAIYLSPFDLNMENGVIEQPFKPTLRIAKRLFDASNRPRGILILNYDGTDLMNNPALGYGDLRSRLLLLNKAGFWLKAQKRDDEFGFMFGRKEAFGDRYPEVWQKMRGADKGQVELASGL